APLCQEARAQNMTAFIDCNGLQISGATEEVMYQDIAANFASDGWEVMTIDGHDFQAIYQALHHSVNRTDNPVAIIARTVMGKGVSLMEHKEEFHGRALTDDEIAKALAELGLENDLARYREMRKSNNMPAHVHPPVIPVVVNSGTPKTYGKDEKTDNRSAFGNALKDIGQLSCGVQTCTPVAVLDCDLATSVKTMGFQVAAPGHFFQGGIQEHNTATMAGALSVSGVLTFFADFGVFGVDETYNQHRLNDINEGNVKLVCTHIGLDVGEDGKTHQCIDYIGVLSNTFGYRAIIPADPNQTDRAVRYVAGAQGNFFVGMGRSKIATILDETGNPFFAGDYRFEYGKADLLRQGDKAAILTMGAMVPYALKAWEQLKAKGISVKLYNVSCPMDIDAAALKDAAASGLIITIEDHNARTGLGSMVANALIDRGLSAKLKKMGVTTYSGSGNPDLLYKSMGLGVDDLVKAVEEGL
ncbi:MAG: transketolase, partial [Nitrospirota bacterium]|nr:transketolase [Nitrospirota bacterium]